MTVFLSFLSRKGHAAPHSRCDGYGFLLRIMREDDAGILCAFVRPLLIACHWVVGAQVNTQKIRVRNDRGVIRDLHDLRMAGLAGTHLLIRRVCGFAAAITAFETTERPSSNWCTTILMPSRMSTGSNPVTTMGTLYC